MRILTSAPVADLHGSVAGITFKRSGAGDAAQSKRSAPPRTTTTTMQRHAFFSSLNTTWHTMTPAQRNAWNLIYISLSASGNNKAPRRFQSAQALFISHNQPRLIFGLAVQITAPTLATTNAPFKQIATLSTGAYFYINFTLDPLLSGEYCFVDWTTRVPASATARKISFSYHYLYTGPIAVPWVLPTAETNPVGTSRWLQLRRHSSSRLTSCPLPRQCLPI